MGGLWDDFRTHFQPPSTLYMYDDDALLSIQKKKEKRKAEICKNNMSRSGVLLLFAHGMQVEVPLGTVHCFNPLLLSPDKLSEMPDVQVCIGGSSVVNSIIFQTKQAVLKNFPNSLLGAQHSFETHTGLSSSIEEAPIKQISIENRDGLKFFPMLLQKKLVLGQCWVFKLLK